MEYDSRERLLFVDDLIYVIADCLALSILVRCDIYGICVLCKFFNFAYYILVVGGNFVFWGKIAILNLYTKSLFWQVADMPFACHHFIIAT